MTLFLIGVIVGFAVGGYGAYLFFRKHQPK
jgi:hypothetical protein